MLNRVFILFLFISNTSSNLAAQYSARWMTSIGGKYGEVWQNSEIDTEGNTYISGWFQSDTCWFGESDFLIKQPGVQNNFLAKINSFGQVEWIHHIYSKLYVFAVPALETDDNGNVYIGASYYSDSMTVAGQMTFYKPAEYSSSIFLMKFNSSGQLVNQKQWFGGPGATCKSLYVNQENNLIIMAGEFQFYCNFESFILNGDPGSSSFEPYVLELSNELDIDTAFSISGIGRRYVTDVNFSQTGNTILSGYFQDGYMIIEEDTLFNTSSKTDFYIISFDNTLNPQWHQRSFGADNERVTRIITDKSGNIFTSISFEGESIALEDTVIYKDAIQISFIVGMINSSGEYQWIKNASFKSSGIVSDLTLIDSNSFVVSGSYDGDQMSIESTEIYNPDPNKSEAFLYKMNRINGKVINGFSYGGFDDQSADKVHSNLNGDIFISGAFFSDSLKVDDQVIHNMGNRDFYLLKLKLVPVSSPPIFSETKSVKIFPNPANFIININSEKAEIHKVVIQNFCGNRIIIQNNPEDLIDISNLIPGLYLCSIYLSGKRVVVNKLIIQR